MCVMLCGLEPVLTRWYINIPRDAGGTLLCVGMGSARVGHDGGPLDASWLTSRGRIYLGPNRGEYSLLISGVDSEMFRHQYFVCDMIIILERNHTQRDETEGNLLPSNKYKRVKK